MNLISKCVTTLLATLTLASFGQENIMEQKEATARVIRLDDLAALKDAAQLPNCTTGTLLSDQGHVFTSRKLWRETDKDAQVECLVLFPDVDDTGENVQAVKAYLGHFVLNSAENETLVVKVDGQVDGMPKCIKVAEAELDNVRENKPFMLIGYKETRTIQGFTLNQKEQIIERLKTIAKDVKLLEAQGKPACGVVDNSRSLDAALMAYMTPNSVPGSVTSVSGQQINVDQVMHNIAWDVEPGKLSPAAGSVMIDDKVCVGFYTDNNRGRNVQAIWATARLGRIPLGTAELPMSKWLIYGGIGLLVSVLAVLICVRVFRKRGTDPVDPPVDPPVVPPVDPPVEKYVVKLRGEPEESGKPGAQYKLTSKQLRAGVVLGRSSSVDCRFPIATVSGRHAMLRIEEHYVKITDLGSKGGTFVNGQAVPHGQAVKVRNGDVIKLAGYAIKVNDIR